MIMKGLCPRRYDSEGWNTRTPLFREDSFDRTSFPDFLKLVVRNDPLHYNR